MVGLQAAQGITQFIQGTQAANAMEEHQDKLFRKNQELAGADARRQFAALGERMVQEQAAAAEAMDEVATKGERARAALVLSGGEAGVGGASLQAAMRDFKGQELRAQNTTLRNLAFTQAQMNREAEGVRIRQEGQVLSALPQPIQKPNFLNTALQIGSAAAGTLFGNFYDFDTGSWNFGSTGGDSNFEFQKGNVGGMA